MLHATLTSLLLLTLSHIKFTLIISPSILNSSHSSACIEADFDYLLVYNGADATGVLLGNFSGALDNAPDIVSVGPSMFLTFHSDSFVESPGFEMSWQGGKLMFVGVLACVCDIVYVHAP